MVLNFENSHKIREAPRVCFVIGPLHLDTQSEIRLVAVVEIWFVRKVLWSEVGWHVIWYCTYLDNRIYYYVKCTKREKIQILIAKSTVVCFLSIRLISWRCELMETSTSCSFAQRAATSSFCRNDFDYLFKQSRIHLFCSITFSWISLSCCSIVASLMIISSQLIVCVKQMRLINRRNS